MTIHNGSIEAVWIYAEDIIVDYVHGRNAGIHEQINIASEGQTSASLLESAVGQPIRVKRSDHDVLEVEINGIAISRAPMRVTARAGHVAIPSLT
jgi:hypothetical protein